jgi:MFS family permease
MAVLLVGRIIQGLGVGALVVALYVATARTLPQSLHPRLFALFSSAWVIPAIIGPAIAGWIVEHAGWRWLFLGVLILLAPSAVLILPPLRSSAERAVAGDAPPRLAPWAMLAGAGCIALALGAQAGRWATPVVLASMVAVVLASWRLLPTGTLRLARGLPTVIALRGLNSAAFFLCEAFVPLWLHQQCGWSITAACKALTGGAVSWSLGSYLQSRITDEARRLRWLGRGCRLLAVGICVCAASVLGLLPEWMMLTGWSLAGLGVGLSLPMLGVLTLKLSPREQQGIYSSALQLCAALTTSAALATGGLAFSLLQADRPTLAYLSVYTLAALLALIATMNAGRTQSG